jgi:heme/copper-type cytochrome/quinol oxidase subunit 4
MNSVQRKPSRLPALLAMAVAVTVFLIPGWLPAEFRSRWEWIIVTIQGIGVVAIVVYLVWFVRKQRDDYWRERGKDPKHPEL